MANIIHTITDKEREEAIKRREKRNEEIKKERILKNKYELIEKPNKIIKSINIEEEINNKLNFEPKGTLCNIGYYGNNTNKSDKLYKKSRVKWSDMITRCYNKETLRKHPEYLNCSVCDEWLDFSNFQKWYNDNHYVLLNESLDLDKDILIRNNTIYSQDTCLLVPHRINTLFRKTKYNNT